MADISTRAEGNHLVLEATIAAPRAAVWRCWTEAALLPDWFAPKPWTVSDASLDIRPGGVGRFTMCGPEGERFPSAWVYLEVRHGERLIGTDAYAEPWVPSAKPFMTLDLALADAAGGGTHYLARALHWSETDREEHEKMGFHEGWTTCTRQLEELARTL